MAHSKLNELLKVVRAVITIKKIFMMFLVSNMFIHVSFSFITLGKCVRKLVGVEFEFLQLKLHSCSSSWIRAAHLEFVQRRC